MNLKTTKVLDYLFTESTLLERQKFRKVVIYIFQAKIAVKAVSKLIKKVSFYSVNNKATPLQVALKTINSITNDYNKINIVYMI